MGNAIYPWRLSRLAWKGEVMYRRTHTPWSVLGFCPSIWRMEVLLGSICAFVFFRAGYLVPWYEVVCTCHGSIVTCVPVVFSVEQSVRSLRW